VGIQLFGLFSLQLLKARVDLVTAGFSFLAGFLCGLITGGCQVTLAVDLFEQVISVQLGWIDFLAGSGDNIRVEPKSVCNRECVGTPGQADHQAVSGAQRVEVKLKAGIGDTLGGVRVSLEFGVMGGHDRGDPPLEHEVQHGACQGGTFLRISSRSKFI